MKKIVCRDYAEMSARAAEMVAEQVRMKPESVLGLATGSTPVGMYENLRRMHAEGRVDFARVVTFNLDEYYPIRRSDGQSYYRFMQENLFGGVNIAKENVFIPNGEAEDPDGECASYERRLAEAGGVDLQVLGIGRNGHIGFNEPADELVLATHVVDLAEDTIEANARFFERAEDVPRRALTMGMGGIFGARQILLLVSGVEKAAIVRELFSGRVSCRVPASLLNLHGGVTVVMDEAAAGLLEV